MFWEFVSLKSQSTVCVSSSSEAKVTITLEINSCSFIASGSSLLHEIKKMAPNKKVYFKFFLKNVFIIFLIKFSFSYLRIVFDF